MRGLEVPVADASASAAIAVAVVNPRQVREFARVTERPAKTDRQTDSWKERLQSDVEVRRGLSTLIDRVTACVWRITDSGEISNSPHTGLRSPRRAGSRH